MVCVSPDESRARAFAGPGAFEPRGIYLMYGALDAVGNTAALGLADLLPTRKDKTAALLPPLTAIRSVSRAVARAVGVQAIKDGLAQVDESELEAELAANIWEPEYEPYQLAHV